MLHVDMHSPVCGHTGNNSKHELPLIKKHDVQYGVVKSFIQWQLGYKVLRVCVYYCSTFDKAVRVGAGGDWRTCATRDDEPRTVCVFITAVPITKLFA